MVISPLVNRVANCFDSGEAAVHNLGNLTHLLDHGGELLWFERLTSIGYGMGGVGMNLDN
jgi:hypothetical protein